MTLVCFLRDLNTSGGIKIEKNQIEMLNVTPQAPSDKSE